VTSGKKYMVERLLIVSYPKRELDSLPGYSIHYSKLFSVLFNLVWNLTLDNSTLKCYDNNTIKSATVSRNILLVCGI
jgi:hypothetical protein